MRIAVGGIHIECSTYNPVLNEEKDFRVLRGEALLDAPYFAFLRDYDAEFLPTIHARAIAGGPVSRATYEAFKGEFLERLKPMLPLDGLYLAMHGAMYVEGMEDAEGDWISAARALVGKDCTVSASYDLHGNVTQRIIDALDIYSTYRTAPHIDVEETMRRSVSMLVKSLKTGERPSLLWAPIPVVLPGERTSTVDEPAKSLYDMLPGIDAIDGVWDASLMVGYVWADEPRATAAAIMTGTDRTVLEREAKRLARAYWDAREDFVFGCETGSVEECVERAIASPTAPVVLAESGDNPTGGGVGDRADVLAELIARAATGVVFAGIADKAATRPVMPQASARKSSSASAPRSIPKAANRLSPDSPSSSCTKLRIRATARRWFRSVVSISCFPPSAGPITISPISPGSASTHTGRKSSSSNRAISRRNWRRSPIRT